MTPLEIEILLHYYARPGDYRCGDFSAPAVRSAMDRFIEEGLLEKINLPPNVLYDTSHTSHRLTYRGKIYVEEGLCKVPLPIQMWLIPK